jgi:DNA-binding NarL/FixJ family response regulator
MCGLNWGAYFKLDADVRMLFPYINGSLKGVQYHYQPLHVCFAHRGVRCTLYPAEEIPRNLPDPYKLKPDPARPQMPLRNSFGVRIQSDLTPRETQVLRLVAEGASNPEISAMLHISPHTVKSHMIHIFNKLNVNDRNQAAVWATRNRVI